MDAVVFETEGVEFMSMDASDLDMLIVVGLRLTNNLMAISDNLLAVLTPSNNQYLQFFMSMRPPAFVAWISFGLH